MRTLFESINERLGRGEQVCLAIIVRQKGSTPRDAGSMMAVYVDGSIAGTIGGGFVEAEVIQVSQTLMKQGGSRRVSRHFSMTDGKFASSMGMVCGGEIEVLISLLESGDKLLFTTLLRSIEESPCFLAVPLGAEPVTGDAIVLVDNEHGVGEIDSLFVRSQMSNPPSPLAFYVQGREWFFCPVLGNPKVYFFGGGHVSRATAEIAALAGFAPIVIDDREELVTPEFFPSSSVHCVLSLLDCVSDFSLKKNDFVVIASRIPLLDSVLLEQVLATSAGFVGMLGSIRKRDVIFAELLKKGVVQKEFERVHCPLGVSIGARTPQEIGVSIVAELIQARRAGL